MDWSFLDVFWAICIFFAWVFFFWLLIMVFSDLFRRHDIGGGMKTLWVLFVIFLPFLGVFIYLISQGRGMGERSQQQAQAAQAAVRLRGALGGRDDRARSPDREGQGAARLRRDHPVRVRDPEGEGARGVLAGPIDKREEESWRLDPSS